MEAARLIRESNCVFVCDRAALHQEGLFRVNGNVRAVETLKQRLDGGEHVDLSDSDSCTVASLIKQFLRDLPEGLVNATVQQALIHCYHGESNYTPWYDCTCVPECVCVCVRTCICTDLQNKPLRQEGSCSCTCAYPRTCTHPDSLRHSFIRDQGPNPFIQLRPNYAARVRAST